MSFTFGTPAETTTSGATATVTVTSVPSGASIVVYVGWNPAVTLNSVSDGTAYTQQGSTVVSGSSADGSVWLLNNASAGSHTVTVTFSASTALYVVAFYVSGTIGADGCSGRDNSFLGTGANAIKGGSVTTTTNGDAIIGIFDTVSLGGTITAGTGFSTLGFATTNNFGEQLVQGSAGAAQATCQAGTSGDVIGFTLAMMPIPPPVFLPYSTTQFFVTDQVIQF